MSHTDFEIRVFRRGDEERVLAFHNAAFPGHAPRSRRHFDWKFLANPGGPPELALALDGDRCVAVYGGLPVRCILRGEPIVAGLHTDVAVAPHLRRGLAGTRLIIAVGREYTRRFVTGVKPIEWGYPEPGLQRVVVRYLGVDVLRDVCYLVQRAERTPVDAGGVACAITPGIAADADALWLRCAGELGTATVRDARYLSWRYVDHPDVTHVLLEARSGSELRGIAVLREGGPDPRLLTVMDWLVPTDDREAERALLSRAGAEARARGRPFVGAWLPLALPIARRWQEDYGFLVHSTPFQECYRAKAPGLGRRWLAENWYQTTGDVDFY